MLESRSIGRFACRQVKSLAYDPRMVKYDEFMDEALRRGRQPFSQRFGHVDLLGQRTPTATSHKAVEDSSFIAKKSMSIDKIDFSDDSLASSLRKDDDDYSSSGLEQDLMTPDIANRFPPGKNFPCPYRNCKKVYTSSYGLKYHMDHGHTAAKTNERRPYVCRIGNCGKTYKNNNGLKYHILHAHKGETYDETEYNI